MTYSYSLRLLNHTSTGNLHGSVMEHVKDLANKFNLLALINLEFMICNSEMLYKRSTDVRKNLGIYKIESSNYYQIRVP